ncbi:hypothetical protein [Mesorhizobium sp. NZP2298]|uniref:hypothetical protein n=1 Tax=Mesorhizobium sp. NZP2298 TaxID=2483403 RepID=UPI001552CF1F|nr:hypothetical protein [Mesorhizobium sp. NZP2298]
MDSHIILRAGQFVGSVLALFGAVLLAIAPPLPDSACNGLGSETANSGIASFIVLALTLVVLAATRQRRTRALQRTWWLWAIALFLASIVLAPTYLASRQSLTAAIYDSSPELSGNRVVIGLWTDPEGLQTAKNRGLANATEMIKFFGCDEVIPRLWPWGAVIWSYIILMALYISCLLAIISSLLAVSEGVFGEFGRH